MRCSLTSIARVVEATTHDLDGQEPAGQPFKPTPTYDPQFATGHSIHCTKPNRRGHIKKTKVSVQFDIWHKTQCKNPIGHVTKVPL